jgi:hypothetical protein
MLKDMLSFKTWHSLTRTFGPFFLKIKDMLSFKTWHSEPRTCGPFIYDGRFEIFMTTGFEIQRIIFMTAGFEIHRIITKKTAGPGSRMPGFKGQHVLYSSPLF